MSNPNPNVNPVPQQPIPPAGSPQYAAPAPQPGAQPQYGAPQAGYQGAPVAPAYPQQYAPQGYQQPNPTDTGSFGWAVLGFFIPLVGLILFLVWKNEKPLSAKKAGMGALVSVILTVALYVIFIVIGIFVAMSSAS